MASLSKRTRNWLDQFLVPAEANAILRLDRAQQFSNDPGPQRIIEEGIAWLCRAQDQSNTQDGGVARHYSLISKWAPSYPETTGYIVPTLLSFAQTIKSEDLIKRVRRMLDWLVSIQFAEGGFQGGMVNQKPRIPVTFNTGQILIGLAAGAALDSRYIEPMRRAADWLVETQASDGAWRNHPSPFCSSGAKAYDTHVALGLLEAASIDGSRGYAESALRQVDWALRSQAPNGWFSNCCLTDFSRPLTHTLGYALRGIIGAYQASNDDRYLNAACRTADGLLTALGSEGWLSGALNSDWRPAVNWVCMTGVSQIAECWFLLHGATGRNDYKCAGQLANKFIRQRILVDGNAEIRGGVKGSFPVDGEYGCWQYLNWACKFTIDANRLELEHS